MDAGFLLAFRQVGRVARDALRGAPIGQEGHGPFQHVRLERGVGRGLEGLPVRAGRQDAAWQAFNGDPRRIARTIIGYRHACMRCDRAHKAQCRISDRAGRDNALPRRPFATR